MKKTQQYQDSCLWSFKLVSFLLTLNMYWPTGNPQVFEQNMLKFKEGVAIISKI